MDLKYYKRYYCKDIENVENFEKAKADNFKGWHCHHRLETHTSDGERRLVDISQKELKALGMYYNRPAEELVFLASREHNAFKKGKYTGENNPMYGKHHSAESKKKNSYSHKGKHFSEETKNKISEAKKGEKHPMYGKHHTEETRKKLSEAAKGNTATKGMRWFNNGKINIRAKECPDGFTPGQLRR